MRLLETIKFSSDFLEQSGVEDSLVDAELLILHATGMERLRAYIENPELERNLRSKINRLVKRRAAGEPLQYILGHVDFLGLELRVGKGVLIPRPETELLVQEAISTIGRKNPEVGSSSKKQTPISIPQSLYFLDLCAGSGCIALALAKEFPSAKVYATDVSANAIKYARDNADQNSIRNVTFLKGSLFAPVAERLFFDLITANPPYIRSSDISGLQREVKDWEPVEALDGGADGLDFFRTIFSEAPEYLKDNGSIFLELGFGQAEAASKLAGRACFKNIELIKDFAGIDRVLKAEK
jgi:release factor glutamine methyltransferase